MGALPRERGHCWVKKGSPFRRPEKMQMTTATPLEEALIGLCIPGAPSPSTAEELT